LAHQRAGRQPRPHAQAALHRLPGLLRALRDMARAGPPRPVLQSASSEAPRCVRCVWSFRHYPPVKDWHFPFNIPKGGADNSKGIEAASQWGRLTEGVGASVRTQTPTAVAVVFIMVRTASRGGRGPLSARSVSRSKSRIHVLTFIRVTWAENRFPH
jgi:hypothetical protein